MEDVRWKKEEGRWLMPRVRTTKCTAEPIVHDRQVKRVKSEKFLA